MTSEAIEFDVRGMPVSQGSARAFVAGGKAVIVTGASKGPLADWRHAIAEEARSAAGGALFEGPLRVTLRFRFPRPRSHFLPANSKRPVPVLRLDAPVYLAGKPDADKVARAGLDALTGVVWGDDAQVADLTVVKRYVGEGEAPGVRVYVHTLPVTS